MAVGKALAARLEGSSRRVYCMVGDGESQSGHIWEAVMSAGRYRLDNLCAIVDYNQVQQTDLVLNILDLEPFADKFRASEWHALEIDGHDHAAILAAFEEAASTAGRPTAIIAHTVKGKGVSWMELSAAWHGKAPTREEGDRALAEIRGSATA